MIPTSPMGVVALVSEGLRPTLAAALPHTVFCATWQDVERCLLKKDAVALFVDPSTDPDLADRVLQLRARFAQCSPILYMRFQPGQFQSVIAVIRAGVEVVLAGFEDHPGRFRQIVGDLEFRQAFPDLVSTLEPQLRRLPRALRAVVCEALLKSRPFHSTKQLAAICAMSERQVFRQLRRAGFVSVRRLLLCGSVIRASRLLAIHGRSARSVANELDYPSVEQLCRHCVELTGFTPSEIKRGVSAEEFHAAVIASILTPPSTMARRQSNRHLSTKEKVVR